MILVILITALILVILLVGGFVFFMMKKNQEGQPESLKENKGKEINDSPPTSELSARRKGLSRVHTVFPGMDRKRKAE